MSTKQEKIEFGISKIQDILRELNPRKVWDIQYASFTDPKEHLDDWDIKYYNIFANEEYVLIYENENLLYAINVTGDSVLCTLDELMRKLVDKF